MNNIPLAERIRPKTLAEFVSQTHLLGEGAALRIQIEKGIIPSIILWGPPGVGKTTLASIIAEVSVRPFYQLSAINSGVQQVREVIDKARKDSGLFTVEKPILFIDEIHRFSKSQQDSLLAAVEKGWISLIGATTENPSFEVIPALLSRCQTHILKPFEKEALEQLLHRAIQVDIVLKQKNIHLKQTDALINHSGGDARKLLNLFEMLVNSIIENPIIITNERVMQLIQENPLRYDKTGEQHYDIVSAFIKSIRGSDPNAAVYWLARMIEGGEDIKFIARRMIIAASEDIGLANPTALVMANNSFTAATAVGYPEARIILSQCAIYLATSPKSNASYVAINKAQETVKRTGDLSVPLALRNTPTAFMKSINYGEGYKYSHDYEGNFVSQEFLPKELSGTKFYEPNNNSKENNIRVWLRKLWGKYSY